MILNELYRHFTLERAEALICLGPFHAFRFSAESAQASISRRIYIRSITNIQFLPFSASLHSNFFE